MRWPGLVYSWNVRSSNLRMRIIVRNRSRSTLPSDGVCFLVSGRTTGSATAIDIAPHFLDTWVGYTHCTHLGAGGLGVSSRTSVVDSAPPSTSAQAANPFSIGLWQMGGSDVR